MSRARLRLISGAGLTAVALWTASIAVAGNLSPDCGIVREYTAPVAASSTAGSIAFGLTGEAETISPDATLLGATASNLYSGMLTCLNLGRTGGTITSLEFAPEGTIAGPINLLPDFESSGQDFYLLADRLPIPADVVASDPGLAALILVPFQAGADSSFTFTFDTASGNPTDFTGLVTISGTVAQLDNDDVTVGAATLTADLIDAAARAAFEQAEDAGVPVMVEINGAASLDEKTDGPLVTITLSVELVVPTPAPTDAPPPAAPSATASPTQALLPDTAVAREH